MFQSCLFSLSICGRCKFSKPLFPGKKRKTHQEDRKGQLNWGVWWLNQIMEENPLESLRVMSFVSLIAVAFNPTKRDLRSIAATSTSDNSVTYWCGRGWGVGQTCHNLPLPVPCSPAFRTFASLCLSSPAFYFAAPVLLPCKCKYKQY